MNHLRAAKDAIDRRYAEPLDIPTLARTALTSEAHFIRSFKDVMGETPTAYRDRHRGAPPPMIPGCFTLMWTRKSSFPDAGPGGRD